MEITVKLIDVNPGGVEMVEVGRKYEKLATVPAMIAIFCLRLRLCMWLVMNECMNGCLPKGGNFGKVSKASQTPRRSEPSFFDSLTTLNRFTF